MAKFIAGLMVVVLLLLSAGPQVFIIVGLLLCFMAPVIFPLAIMIWIIRDSKKREEKEKEEEKNNPRPKKIYIIK